MNFCQACGEPLLGESPRFCAACGAPVTPAAPAEAAHKEPEGGIFADQVSPEFYDMMFSLSNPHRCWECVLNTHVIGCAEQWFGDPWVSSAELFQHVDPDLGRSLRDEGEWEADAHLSNSFVLMPFAYPTGRAWNPRVDVPIPWSQTTQGARVARVIDGLGIAMAVTPGDDGLAGWWPTNGGGTSVQFCQAFHAANGMQYLYWYSTPLASLGTFVDNDVARLGLTVAVPSVLQTIAYLSECPTPLEPGPLLLLGGRNRVVFGEPTTTAHCPQPVARLTVTETASGTYFFARNASSGMIDAYPAGGRVDLGYAIPLDASDESLGRAIHVAVNATIWAANILEDGFLNHTDDDIAIGRNLLSQSAVVNGADQTWVPTSLH